MKTDIRDKQRAQLSMDIGVELPEVKPAAGDPSTRVAMRMLRFAADHGYVITPVGYLYLIDIYLKVGHCPCKADRLECPCPQSVDEIEKTGSCFCTMFWKDYNAYCRKHSLDIKEGAT